MNAIATALKVGGLAAQAILAGSQLTQVSGRELSDAAQLLALLAALLGNADIEINVQITPKRGAK